MNILLCHERFVFRYGVDRVLLLLAREFRRRGHRVTLLGNTFDATTATEPWADRIVRVPVAAPTLAADVGAAEWLADHWEEHFGGGDRPEVVLAAGWPFLSAIPLFASRGCRVFFNDHGIIPDEGMPEIGWRTLSLLRELKGVFVPQATGIIAVSRFVADTQSASCARGGRPVEVIANGADHASEDMWGEPEVGPAMPSGARPSITEAERSRRSLRILCTGRFEPGTYKQSELVFVLEKRIRAWSPEAWVGVLASPEQVTAAAAGVAEGSRVEALGHPTDAAMFSLMRSCDAVVCLSRWEGFNLPLAEAQVLGRPCLVFDLGAHREVVADPWLLCADLDEMDAKIRALTDGTAPAGIRDGSAFHRWAERFRWVDVADRYLGVFAGGRAGDGAGENPPSSTLGMQPAPDGQTDGQSAPGGGWLIVDVTNAARDPANSGCVRVTRRLGAEWQRYLPVLFVVWERSLEAFRFPTGDEFRQLGAYEGPARPGWHPVSGVDARVFLAAWIERGGRTDPASRVTWAASGWLVLPEIRHREDLWPILEFAAIAGLRTASVFHDAIPLQRPDLVPDPAYREGHADYMRGLSRVDLNVANSRASAAALRDFWRSERLSGRVEACLLPGGLPGERPTDGRSGQHGAHEREAPFVLMVSTLEPRKGFRRLIEAFLAARRRSDSSGWKLVLVGGRSWWSADLVAFVEEAVRTHPGLTWVENATDDHLRELYRDCAFTVYASEIEGFGLPIMESIWHGRPCLCHHAGVMLELAGGGGCLTADLLDPAAFEEALLRLMDDPALCRRLAGECRARSVKRWSDYAAEFLARMAFARWSELEAWAPAGAAHAPRGGDARPRASAIAANAVSEESTRPHDGGRASGSSLPAGRSAPVLSLIIPTYNRLDLLQACLASLEDTLPSDLEAEIILVDDASDDGTREWLEHYVSSARPPAAAFDKTRSSRADDDDRVLSNAATGADRVLSNAATEPNALPVAAYANTRPPCRLLRNPTNRGYGASVNRAARLARGETLVLLNHDLRLRPGWLEPMLEAGRAHPRAFAIGNLQNAATDGALDHAGTVFNTWGHPEHFRGDPHGVAHQSVREFPAITFACTLVDRGRFLALGGFDSRFLNGFEDVDLCLRARFRGWPCHVANRSVVDHQVSATPGRRIAEAENLRRFFARWHMIAVILGRDWAERLFWERHDGIGLPDDSRRPGPWRVLVDLTSPAGEDGVAMSDEFRRAVAVLPRSGEEAFSVVALVSLNQIDGPMPWADETWVLTTAGDVAPVPLGVRRLREASITLARRLEADVLCSPSDTSRFVCPDIPFVSLPDDADTSSSVVALSGRAGTLSVSSKSPREPSLGDAGPLAATLVAAIRNFGLGGISWRWAATRQIRLPATTPPAGPPVPSVATPDGRLRFCIDEPAHWTDRTPMLLIRGWCLDLEGGAIRGIVAHVSDGRHLRGAVGLPRPDVASAFPADSHAGGSGFAVRVPVGCGPLTLRLEAEIGGGLTASLGTWTVGE